MTKEEINKLSQEIESLSNNFEDKALKDNFDVNSINTPKHYRRVIRKIEEILSEARGLFLYSVFNRVCKEEGVPCYFETPYQANMRYDAVMKKGGVFYLLDEDGHYRDIFVGEKFMHFIDNLYWKLYDKEESDGSTSSISHE